jgi:hypothetical protein
VQGSFRNPSPGSPVSIPSSNNALFPGQKVTDNEDPIARQNFRVVIIKPQEVEQVDLSDASRSRRWKFTYVGASSPQPNHGEKIGDWVLEELWP